MAIILAVCRIVGWLGQTYLKQQAAAVSIAGMAMPFVVAIALTPWLLVSAPRGRRSAARGAPRRALETGGTRGAFLPRVSSSH
jgi:hypothetical protein